MILQSLNNNLLNAVTRTWKCQVVKCQKVQLEEIHFFKKYVLHII